MGGVVAGTFSKAAYITGIELNEVGGFLQLM
jgi:hypothetical protein